MGKKTVPKKDREKHLKKDSKSFYAFTRSKSRVENSVGRLMDDNGSLTSSVHSCYEIKMAAGMEKDDQKATTTILHMLLSACDQESNSEESEGLNLSRLIDQRCHEVFGHRLESPVNVENFDITGGLLAVLRECLLAHRWAAALRVLTSVVHRLPKRHGRTVLHCVLELCAQLSLPLPDSLLLQLKTYAELTEHQVTVVENVF